ncbi:MAG: response regulator [Deferrisomatales bacterium]|nr:response regulator [Deferrisomatales bacterium]
MRVLIVDDNLLFREIVRSVVRVNYPSAVVREAEDVVSALAAAKHGGTDVAYVDLCLPDGNGLDVLERLREANGDAVLACCTNYDYPEYGDESLRRGADFFIPKESLDAGKILAVMAEGCRRGAEAGGETVDRSGSCNGGN